MRIKSYGCIAAFLIISLWNFDLSHFEWCPSALAQSEEVTQVARQRYEDGVKAYDAGRYDEARTAFSQAYALKKHPAVLFNLGQSEFRSNRLEDAGNHLRQFLREHPAATKAQRDAAEQTITEIQKKSAEVKISTDVSGAIIRVDNAKIGKSPLADPLFVTPGKHSVNATLEDKTVSETVDAKSGTLTRVSLSLEEPKQAPVAIAPVKTPSPVFQPIESSPEPIFDSNSSTTTASSESFWKWYSHKPIAWIGTAVAGTGLVLGIVFSVNASNASNVTEDYSEQIRTHSESDPATGYGASPPCGNSASGDLAGYEKACSELRNAMDDYDSSVTVATAGWITFGAATTATIIYGILDSKHPKKTIESGSSIRVSPFVSPEQRGAAISISF